MKKIDLRNKLIGDLIVEEPAGHTFYGKNKIALWQCKCSCGKRLVVSSQLLLKKKYPKSSCGCKNYTKPHANRKGNDPKIVSFRSLIKRYRNSANNKIKNIKWFLSEDEAISLFSNNCYYCGVQPNNTYNVYITKHKRYITKNKTWADLGTILFNGIDRLNSDLDYSLSNCVSCCTTCNFAKNELSVTDFLHWVNRIAIYQGYKK